MMDGLFLWNNPQWQPLLGIKLLGMRTRNLQTENLRIEHFAYNLSTLFEVIQVIIILIGCTFATIERYYNNRHCDLSGCQLEYLDFIIFMILLKNEL
jgi:hypothetical protein